MKRFILVLTIVSALCTSTETSAKKDRKVVEYPASDPRIEYTGRVVKKDNGISFDWSGVYCRIRFNGPSLSVRCSDTMNSWFNIWTDKEMGTTADRSFLIAAKDTVIILAEGLGKGEHEIILQKRTEGEQGLVTFHSFIAQGDLLQANGRKGRHIEFIGDSYTCGYGTESSSKNDPFKAETENCNLTYAAITARYFNADFNLVSHSGQGIDRNYNDGNRGYNMPDRYRQAFDCSKDTAWNPEMAPHQPDIVVIYLCTNDFSTGRQPQMESFCKRYIELLKQVKENYGKDIPILCMGSNCSPYTYDYIRNACQMIGLDNVSYMVVSKGAHNNEDELGASWHPNYKGHIKVASCMIPYISTLTGWEMEEKPYR